ncbi:MAG: glycosyltransferase family 39 protein [Planctomycetota bacterium]
MSRHAARDLSIVLGVAIGLRVIAVLTLPLIITNDGAYYLLWGSEIASGRWPDLPAYRTPTYPLFLAAVISLAGHNVHAVLAAQHALGAATAIACWFLGRSAFRPRVGLIGGLLVAVDPWLLAISSFALSDVLTIALPLCALAAVSGRPGMTRSVFGGICMGAAILARPTSVAWLPGVIALVAVAPTCGVRRRLARVGALMLAISLVLTPWVAFNATRGIVGVARTEGLAMWGGLARSSQLDENYPLPNELTKSASDLFQHTPPESAVMRFYRDAGRHETTDRGELLSAWSRASMRADPLG